MWRTGLVLLLAACAQANWMKAGATQADYNTASYECERDKRQSGYFGPGLIGLANASAFYDKWMVARGWSKLQPGAAAAQDSKIDGLAEMYPGNPKATAIGPFTVAYKDLGLQGSVSFTMPNGETFQGTYTTTDSGAPDSLLGRLDAFGSNGTTVACEYTVNRRSRLGTGACATSQGAQYRMHFSVIR